MSLCACVHDMPFGAAILDCGAIRFRLWAPAANAPAVRLVESGRRLEMTPAGDGFFELVSEEARPGDRYLFCLDDGSEVPDPASRFQPEDVNGPSQIIDPLAYRWQTSTWRGLPWHEAVIYELHLGSFSPRGGYAGLEERLDHLASLGVSAIELMPIADFAGTRNWGYDGVLPFAPDSTYGRPDDLKALIDACHGRGLMVMLDVVYNHFGPEGNHLSRYAPEIYDNDSKTPWGPAINYRNRAVRNLALHNVLFWLEEYRFDGLRFDAVHQIRDESEKHILVEIAETVRARFSNERHVHLVLENDDNLARLLPRDERGQPRLYDAQWNDGVHHAMHQLLTGESTGYYIHYADKPAAKLAHALATGFVFQEPAANDHAPSGEPSSHLPPVAFVNCLQNHDQIGNRAFGERLSILTKPPALQAMTAILLLSPQIPMLFMGEEWATRQPFCFFTDFHDDLADAVREGRRREFERFPAFADPAVRDRIPDPNASSTFDASKLDWPALEEPAHADWLSFTKMLLALRRERIMPLLLKIGAHAGKAIMHADRAFEVRWQIDDGRTLVLLANLGEATVRLDQAIEGEPIYSTAGDWYDPEAPLGELAPFAVCFVLRAAS